MAPQIPQGFNPHRNLTHVMPSLGASLGAKVANALELPDATASILLMVDGLGLEQLHTFAAHAPFLRKTLQQQTAAQTDMSTVYPSTTAAALSSLGTGLPPGHHGLVGYDVYDPDRRVVINQLGGWDEKTDPLTWQPYPTMFEQLRVQHTGSAKGIEPITISLPTFEDSALTRASLRGASFVGKEDMGQRFQAAVAAAQQPGALIYLYVNELDKAGHQFGPGSQEWLEVLEEIDAQARRMTHKLPAGVLVGMTGDHGMIEVKPEDRIDYAQDEELVAQVAHTAGEPRMVQLHFDEQTKDSDRTATLTAWQCRFGDRAWIVTRQQAIDAGWFGAIDQRVVARIGDILVTGFEPIALYDSRRAAPHSFDMIGHHGAPTAAEVRVPWLVLRTP